jgi:Uma2 family endonuclease
MATQPQTATVTLDDFLAAFETGEERAEFVDGQIVPVAGTSVKHGRLVARILAVFETRFAGGPCGALTGTYVRARLGDNVFLPDVGVFCGEAQMDKLRGVDLLLNPVVLVEVLSHSTADYDHGKKWENYRRIPSLQDYLLVSQDAPLVERYTRQGDGFWLFSETTGLDASIHLESIGVDLALRAVYGGLLPTDVEG